MKTATRKSPLTYSIHQNRKAVYVAGMASSSTGPLCGVFRKSSDARAVDADRRTIAIVGLDELSPALRAVAERNAEKL